MADDILHQEPILIVFEYVPNNFEVLIRSLANS